ncbi:MAG: beta-galactosidase, partial [Nitrosospira sp.]|nr:beta-galactosidase [Nitrosospira sp.]
MLPDGHIGFENKRLPQRFLSASFAFSGSSGGIPDKAEAVRIVAQLRRMGYSAARLHFIDAWLMTGQSKDFDFNQVQLDRLHYLLAQLKANGIYWVIDLLDSDNGAYGGVYPHRWVKKHNLRLDFYTDEDKRNHWLRLVKDIFASRNPYTETSTLQDPALLGVILINEGGIAELSYRSGPGGFAKPYSEKFKPLFLAWLKTRYGNDAALKSAWQGELQRGESLDTDVALPKALRGNDARTRDFMRFVVDLEQDRLQWMVTQVRSLGYKGLATAFNNWGFFQSDLSRSAAGWVDMHTYHAHPSSFVNKGSKIPQTSAIENAARFVRELTNARQWGKPFSVTEYGQPFWNSWRRESVALIPAYAALQKWDLICQFSENSVQLNYLPSPYSRKNA